METEFIKCQINAFLLIILFKIPLCYFITLCSNYSSIHLGTFEESTGKQDSKEASKQAYNSVSSFDRNIPIATGDNAILCFVSFFWWNKGISLKKTEKWKKYPSIFYIKKVKTNQAIH